MTSQTRSSLYVLTSAVMAAFSWLLTEIALRFLQIDPIYTGLGANVSGGLILLAVGGFLSRRSAAGPASDWPGWGRREWLTVLGIALAIYTVAFQLSFNAVRLVGAGKVVLLGRLETLYVVILAVIFLGEPLSPRRVIAVLLAMGGAVLINFNPAQWQLTLGWGELLAILAPLGISTGVILSKPLLDRADAGRVTGLALLFGGLLLIPLTPFAGSGLELSWAPLLVLVLMGLVRGGSWVFYNIGVRHIGASRSSIIFITSAFFTVMLQLLVATLVPALNLRPPDNLVTALVGGGLVGLAIVLLQGESRGGRARWFSPTRRDPTSP